MTVEEETSSRSSPGMAILTHRDLSGAQARDLTEKIKTSMGDVMSMVAKAHIGRVWIALGYESWADYIKGEFAYAPLSLPREERKAVVSLLRGQGMSTRAIASATGDNQSTISRDLSGDAFASPAPEPLGGEIEPATITGLDGKSYQSNRPKPKSEPVEPWRMFMSPCNATGLIHAVELLHNDATAQMFGAEVKERNRLRAEMVDALRKAADTLEATGSHHRPAEPLHVKGDNE